MRLAAREALQPLTFLAETNVKSPFEEYA